MFNMIHWCVQANLKYTMIESSVLVDEGIITQEEFDAKKKQLLGL